MQQVIDARRTAAGARVGYLEQVQLGDGPQQFAWIPGDPLGVRQVAGVVVGGGDRQRVPGRGRPDPGQELGQVLDLAAHLGRTLGPAAVGSP